MKGLESWVIIAYVCGAACGNEGAPAMSEPCSTDLDCKSDRICVEGSCVDPMAPTSGQEEVTGPAGSDSTTSQIGSSTTSGEGDTFLDGSETGDPPGSVGDCNRPCGAPVDCDFPQTPDAPEEWACVDGFCDYLGCASDASCQAGFICSANPILGYSVCTIPCGPDNVCDGFLTCIDGGCHFLNICQDDEDCSPPLECVGAECVQRCQTTEECAPLSPFLACISGTCTNVGCSEDAQCQDFYGGDYVCDG